MDRILIRDLQLRAIIGVFPHERDVKQDVTLNIALEGDFREAARTDALRDAIDYKRVKQRIVEVVESSAYNLIETLAERVAAIGLEHPGVAGVRVIIDKPGALRYARSVAVEIERRRETKP